MFALLADKYSCTNVLFVDHFRCMGVSLVDLYSYASVSLSRPTCDNITFLGPNLATPHVKVYELV